MLVEQMCKILIQLSPSLKMHFLWQIV